jgi:hypothetical protein
MVQDDLKLLEDSGEVPKSNGVVGGSIPGREIDSLLDGELARWSSAFYVQKRMKKEKKTVVMRRFWFVSTYIICSQTYEQCKYGVLRTIGGAESGFFLRC